MSYGSIGIFNYTAAHICSYVTPRHPSRKYDFVFTFFRFKAYCLLYLELKDPLTNDLSERFLKITDLGIINRCSRYYLFIFVNILPFRATKMPNMSFVEKVNVIKAKIYFKNS